MSADPSREEEWEQVHVSFVTPPRPPTTSGKEVKGLKVKTVYNSWLQLNTLVQDQDNLMHTVC